MIRWDICCYNLVLLICLHVITAAKFTDNNTLKISLLSSVKNGKGKHYAGAFFRALHDVNTNPEILPNHTLEYFFADTADTYHSLKAMLWMNDNSTTAFIGPEGTCATEAAVASAMNLPMIAHKCHDSKLPKNGRLRRTFISTQPTTSKISKFIISLLNQFKWKILTMMIENTTQWNETAMSFESMAKENNIEIRGKEYIDEYRRYPNTPKIKNLLDATYRKTRIYVFLGDSHALIKFVRLINNDIPNGEHVVIAADDRQFTSTKDYYKYFLKTPFEKSDDNETENHLRAFKNVLIVAPREPDYPFEWTKFLDDIRNRNYEKPINAPKPNKKILDKIQVKLDVPIHAAYLYDAVTVYSVAASEVLAEGGQVHDGTLVVDKIRSRVFTSIQGFQIYIDENGEAEGNYTVLGLTEAKDNIRFEFKPVGYFRRSSSEYEFPEYIKKENIYWENRKVPKDRPGCGFDYEHCQDEPEDWRPGTICSVLAAVVFVASIFICRHYLYEQKLARLLWKIEYKDLVLVNSVDEIIPPSRPKRKSRTSWRFLLSSDEPERATLLGSTNTDGKGSFSGHQPVHVGSYKGTIVCIKRIYKKNVDINRTLKKQLQLRKELHHDNINRFIGACIDQPNMFIVTKYCTRGSLHDILQNEDINLDDMFIASLVADLIKGMSFIHESDVVSHGNLKSTNCLVDSRWVLQISDFGLQQLASRDSPVKMDEDKRFRSLLWKAPEQLRELSLTSTNIQKCDVYSFAIIMYEILGKQGPWGNIDLSAKEIVQNVKSKLNNTMFRPDLSKLTCEDFVKQCMEDCLSESPDLRPEFKYIRYRLKPMQCGLKANIFDNMLAIMEKYANNLEALVAERTEQLSEEKKMTDNLLYRMLPRPVANRLKKGLSVQPETYNSVTLYFSDIVGFTALSAQSTPMQVIDMLNDLYTCFDAILGYYDVYKVETIGDAYMVVSGLPIRNGDMHAGEIASMSLHLLRAIMEFKIAHKPNETLKLRIGIHSGSCVAGVVGLKMPRFTLFGDTVNTASRMETHGVALKIHCSKECRDILQKLGGYTLSERGYVSMKGKGDQFTYFLEGENTFQRLKRIEKFELQQPLNRSWLNLENNSVEKKSSFGDKSTTVPVNKQTLQNCFVYEFSNMQKSQQLQYESIPVSDLSANSANQKEVDANTVNKRIKSTDNHTSANNNTKSHSFTCQYFRESEKMLLVDTSKISHAYIGPETTTEEV